ncbi:EscU/YscU/HrcU family type III secretion system export apparatus switch protein [Alteribacter aurantiacus]|uniref:EscU/YscU/HrcU family type III secretion system export apparatus switch protein n=1 Tax=Alteribacter aurantiacus TaxID=254410 RepID=UPI003CCC29D7
MNQKRVRGPLAAVIQYDESNDGAPSVVAQGRGDVASQIIEVAKQHGIPMEEDANLLANLLDLDLGEQIPPQLYSVMAEILLLIEEIDQTY